MDKEEITEAPANTADDKPIEAPPKDIVDAAIDEATIQPGSIHDPNYERRYGLWVPKRTK